MELLKYLGETYNKQDKNKPKNNFKYLVYYILLWIVYIDNYYKIYQYLKQQASRYLKRIYQL